VLEAEIAAAEKRMRDDLEGIRARFTNPGIKGSGAEETLRAFLRKYLPRRLDLGHGEVVDTFGNRSKQTDVVIATEDHPFTFTTESPGLFFVEGVAAGGEVKTILTSGEFSSAIENARAFKRMRQKVPKGSIVNFVDAGGPVFEGPPPWFLFAFESQISIDGVRAIFSDLQAKEQLPDDGMPDAVFLMDRGWIVNFHQSSLLKFGEPGKPAVAGWHAEQSPTVLFFMLTWLSSVTPRTMLLGAPILLQYLLPPIPPTAGP
jgi:hypothetical protein